MKEQMKEQTEEQTTENNCKKACKKIVDGLSGLATGKTCSVLAFIILIGLLVFSSILAYGYKKRLDSKKAELFDVQFQLDTTRSSCAKHMFDVNSSRFRIELLERQLKSHENDYRDLQDLRTKYSSLQWKYEFLSRDATILEDTKKEYERQIRFLMQSREQNQKRYQELQRRYQEFMKKLEKSKLLYILNSYSALLMFDKQSLGFSPS